VDLLSLLALDTTNDYVRERLEESELGKIIMFYFKNPNESSECAGELQISGCMVIGGGMWLSRHCICGRMPTGLQATMLL
jgi:hypothetical protein